MLSINMYKKYGDVLHIICIYVYVRISMYVYIMCVVTLLLPLSGSCLRW